MAIVYRHGRLDNNEIFYVGIGKKEARAYTKKGRNNLWNKIVQKTNYNIEILQKDISIEEACELEEFLIFLYGRKDLGTGCLANLTDGGEKNANFSQERLKKMSENAKRALTGRKQSEQSIENRRLALTGKKRTEEQNIARRKSMKNMGYSYTTILRNYQTNEILGEFDSLSDALRFLNLDPKKYSRRASSVANKKRKHFRNYVFEYKDKLVIPPIKEKSKRKPTTGSLVLNLQTGIFYISATEAYNSTDLIITKGSFSRKLKGDRINDTNFIYA